MGARSSKNTTQNNRSDGHLLEYFRNTFVRGGGGTNYVPPPPPGLTATGGVISDYTSGPAVYRAHVFTSTGTFEVEELGGYGDTVEYLVVAGGGGGGSNAAAGGGGGGYRSSVIGESSGGGASAEPIYPVSIGSYSVLIGAGGARDGSSASPYSGMQGGTSVFDNGGPNPISSTGGGGGAGGGNEAPQNGAAPGGSGGGGASYNNGGGTGASGNANQGISWRNSYFSTG